jgi:hypothetical protein
MRAQNSDMKNSADLYMDREMEARTHKIRSLEVNMQTSNTRQTSNYFSVVNAAAAQEPIQQQNSLQHY